jgi:hypothetical protein
MVGDLELVAKATDSAFWLSRIEEFPIILYYCNLSGALIKASTNVQKGDLYHVAGLFAG